MLNVAVVALGGAIGTILRYFISAIVYDYFRNPVFPWNSNYQSHRFADNWATCWLE